MNAAEREREDYERELRYLRSAGAEFARANPAVAARIELSADGSADPHVERLIESFAFLAARLHRKIDDSVSELAANLLEQLCPHATRPLPSATVVRFAGAGGKVDLTGGYRIAPDTPLYGTLPGGDSVYFRTCYPVTLWPLDLVCPPRLETEKLERYSSHPAKRSVLALALRAAPDHPAFLPGAAGLDTLRCYVKGAGEHAARLCDLLYGHTLEVRWRPPGWERRPGIPLAGVLPRFAGLEGADAMLPERGDTHPGLRLLLEYFAFPLKFQFFDLDLSALGRTPHPGAPAAGWGTLEFVFDARPSAALELEPDAIELGCTPAVNLFRRTSEPLRMNGMRSEYKLVADSHRERTTEIYSIEEVASSAPGQRAVPVAPYYGFHGLPGAGPQVYWHARRGPAFKAGLAGSDLMLTFVDPAFDPATPEARTLTARLLCTSRAAAAGLHAGAALHMEDAGDALDIRALHKPSVQSMAAPDGTARWKLVSHLSLNHLSLVDGAEALASLKELLALNNLTGSPRADSQIGALQALRCQAVTRYIADDPWQGYRRGYALTLQVEHSCMRGSVLLFGAVLQRFLAGYAGINTFVELRIEQDDGRALYAWPARASAQLQL